MDQLDVRAPTIHDDMQPIKELLICWTEEHDGPALSLGLFAPSAWLIAERDGEVVACARREDVPGAVYLTHVLCIPGRWGKLGTDALMLLICAEADEQGMPICSVTPSAAVLANCERYGFQSPGTAIIRLPNLR